MLENKNTRSCCNSGRRMWFDWERWSEERQEGFPGEDVGLWESVFQALGLKVLITDGVGAEELERINEWLNELMKAYVTQWEVGRRGWRICRGQATEVFAKVFGLQEWFLALDRGREEIEKGQHTRVSYPTPDMHTEWFCSAPPSWALSHPASWRHQDHSLFQQQMNKYI